MCPGAERVKIGVLVGVGTGSVRGVGKGDIEIDGSSSRPFVGKRFYSGMNVVDVCGLFSVRLYHCVGKSYFFSVSHRIFSSYRAHLL